jgi:hypothetical protein
MFFEILAGIHRIETIAIGRRIREVERLRQKREIKIKRVLD